MNLAPYPDIRIISSDSRSGVALTRLVDFTDCPGPPNGASVRTYEPSTSRPTTRRSTAAKQGACYRTVGA